MTKRKSESGIVLKTGESQLKDGRYRYRYFDDLGKAHDVYAWRLRPEDPIPEGKKHGASLREMEKEITRQIEDGLKVWDASGLTVEKLCKEFMESQKPYWRANTLTSYESRFETHIKPAIGKKKITKVDNIDIENFYLSLANDGLKIGTLLSVNKLLNSAFSTAVKRRIISVNPCTGALGAVKKKIGNQTEQRKALEAEELENLLEYIKEMDPDKYIPCYILAWSGLRIGELAGLCWCDIDFDAEVIRVRRTMEYCKVDGKYQYILNSPKTEAGKREIPMLKDVKKLLLQVRKESKVVKLVSPDKAGLDDTIFRGKHNNPLGDSLYRNFLSVAVERYNKTHDDKLPHISPHIFRHTFTCWLIENFSCGENATLLDNLKYIQSLLGHADAGVTLNVYSQLRKSKLTEKHDILRAKAKNG